MFKSYDQNQLMLMPPSYDDLGPREYPLTVQTNSFGFYHINGVPAGATYVLEISSTRCTFAHFIRVDTCPGKYNGSRLHRGSIVLRFTNGKER